VRWLWLGNLYKYVSYFLYRRVFADCFDLLSVHGSMSALKSRHDEEENETARTQHPPNKSK